MRDIYAVFFTNYRLLPDAVGRQNPWALFALLDSLEKDEQPDTGGNEHLRMLYDL